MNRGFEAPATASGVCGAIPSRHGEVAFPPCAPLQRGELLGQTCNFSTKAALSENVTTRTQVLPRPPHGCVAPPSASRDPAKSVRHTPAYATLLLGPRGPVSGNGRTWPEPNGSGRRGSAANGSGVRVYENAAVPADTGTALPRPHTCLPYRATAHMSSMGCRQPTASAVGHAARAFRRCWWAQMGHRSGCAHAEVLNSPCCHPAPVELRSTLQVVTHRTTTVRGTCISPRTLNPHCNR